MTTNVTDATRSTSASDVQTIAEAFAAAKAEGRPALIPFVTGGYPDMETCEAIALALVDAGADLLEIGVPFSDPMADGTTIQRTSQVALQRGTTLEGCLALAGRLRARGVTIPLVLMGYTNPFLQHGWERLCRDAERIGVSGFIVPDLPAEESDELLTACRRTSRDLVFLVAPTSTDDRLRLVASKATGFIYCVSLTGVTGARSDLAAGLPDYLGRVRAATDLPITVGFGISTADHVATVARYADGAVVASALINACDERPLAEQPAAAAAFLRGLRG